MQQLLTPLPTRVATRAPSRHNKAASQGLFRSQATDTSQFWVAVVLLVALCNLPLLAFMNARGVAASSAMVGLAEALVFALCLGLQLRRLPPWTVALALGLVSWMVLTWLIRQRPDLKSVRDLLIPILFISLGRQVADSVFAERCLRWATAVVLAVGVFEALFTDAYGDLFNTFSFYANLGSISEGSAMFSGQMLTLNGFRPEGIGRTLLPALLGAHRTSSLFLEPVSLGNFAVIVLAWNLSAERKDWSRASLVLVLAALALIVLSDSRFGMLVAGVLLAFRLLPLPTLRWVAPLFPFALFVVLVGIGWLLPPGEDNVLGRMGVSGRALLAFDSARLMGLDGQLPMYGDMGYAYALSRFGTLQVIGLLLVLFLIPCTSVRGERLRALLVVYFFCSLAISGTSAFALKTAALMWFLWGALSADTRLDLRRLKPKKRGYP